ncbi:MAG: hypothetical protein M3Q58_04580 [Bacteroidota bacterium]|nr:hypothetical protein [Bacteroidota bacterium]
MKTLSFLLILSSLLFFTACSETENNETVEAVDLVGTDKNENTSTLNNPVNIENQFKDAGKLNPAHGEPGHRCEIAVGAPLDSEPTQPNVTSIQQQPDLPAPVFTPPADKTPVAKGTNPPHGEPGHDCAIAVGAPLK